ncbi:intercellular trafficking and secretion [Bacidia gigantensis]|uniref:intercellular trafficking and secretion n=1 Tax=Bacidia gigantensis TaxID=2732470 RepID=UPI001D052F17|nr:intercellular trafficking and secretion [Bacidia gigantensis]KAG8526961.1 intercellular trafficking and secretion [Bacidia gigantensis]
MDNDFDSVSWQNEPDSDVSRPNTSQGDPGAGASGKRKASSGSAQAGYQADGVDLAGIGEGRLDCKVDAPLKENDGTKDAYVSYLVTTHTDFASFQKPYEKVRRRFTDFVFLYKELCKQYPQCAVPPLPDKHKMEYVRGDRFGPDFTNRRAHSLHRFLKRCASHPVLRRATLLTIFLESSDWNAHMRQHPKRATSMSEQSTGVFDSFADTFVNAFSKVHKPDKRFIEVREKADKLDEDLGHVSRVIARIGRREADLETDYGDLSTQFLKLEIMEPGVDSQLHAFAQGVEETAKGIQNLKEHTDQNYLGGLRDMEAYTASLKALLKSREQKQLDYEGLTEYLNKASYDRDSLASNNYSQSPASFIRSKIEDARGVDHEQARRERVRKLEMQIERLVKEVEDARLASEAYDGEVVREVQDFERIKAAEFKDSLGALADKHVEFYGGVIETWERYLKDMEADGGVAEL